MPRSRTIHSPEWARGRSATRDGGESVDLSISAEQLERQLEARRWLTANVPPTPLPSMDTPAGKAAHQEWERTLAADRWSVVQWPSEFGGREYDLVDWLLFEEEYYTAGGPPRINHNGLTLLGATLLEHGTPEQCNRILPSMVAGETIWAQAWSEPGAGSDLASVRCRAEPVAEGYKLFGQKTWSSRGAVADRGFGLFRSGEGEGHRGLTYLMFDLSAPGVETRVIRRVDGEPVFAEIFFDGLFVPDEDVIGGKGDGWKVAMSTAGKERGINLRSPGRFLAVADRLVELWRRLPDNRRLAHRDAVQDAWIGCQAYRLQGFASVTDGGPRSHASLGKPYWAELDIALREAGLRIAQDLRDGAESIQEADELAALEDTWRSGLLFALAGPIYAGTNEIQRNIIAERLLGLPRG